MGWTEGARRCALPGCDEAIEIIPGRPERRYCTAAHRAAARRARRAASQADLRLAETLPWLREPVPEPPPAHAVREPVAAAPARPARAEAPWAPEVRPPRPGRRREGPGALRAPRMLTRHRRTLAIIGATAVLVGGYALNSSSPAPTPVRVAPQEMTADEWAGQARIALAGLDTQLASLQQTEQDWQTAQRDPSRAVPTQPVAVHRLEQRRAVLLQQRAALTSQLDAYQSLRKTGDELALADQQLTQLEQVVAELPPAGQRTPDQVAAIAALDEQRDMRARQRDAKRDELRSLDENVSHARRTALPTDTTATDQVAQDVRALTRGERPPRPQPTPTSDRPQVLAGGRENDGDAPGGQVTTSGPPDPRGPRDESTPRDREREPDRAAAPAAAPAVAPTLTDVVSGAADGVDRIVGGRVDAPRPDGGDRRARAAEADRVSDKGDRKARGGKDRDAKQAPAEVAPAGTGGDGPVGAVTGVVGGAVDALTGGGGRSDRPSGGRDRDAERRPDRAAEDAKDGKDAKAGEDAKDGKDARPAEKKRGSDGDEKGKDGKGDGVLGSIGIGGGQAGTDDGGKDRDGGALGALGIGGGRAGTEEGGKGRDDARDGKNSRDGREGADRKGTGDDATGPGGDRTAPTDGAADPMTRWVMDPGGSDARSGADGGTPRDRSSRSGSVGGANGAFWGDVASVIVDGVMTGTGAGATSDSSTRSRDTARTADDAGDRTGRGTSGRKRTDGGGADGSTTSGADGTARSGTADADSRGAKPGRANDDTAASDGQADVGTKPGGKASDDEASGGSKSDSSKSDSSKSDSSRSDDAKSDSSKSDGAKSESSKSDNAKSDNAKPDSSRSDGAKSAGAKSAGESDSKADADSDSAKSDGADTSESGSRSVWASDGTAVASAGGATATASSGSATVSDGGRTVTAGS